MIKDLFAYKNGLKNKYVKIANDVIFDMNPKKSAQDYDHCEVEIKPFTGTPLSAFCSHYTWAMPTILVRYSVAQKSYPNSTATWINYDTCVPLMNLIEEGDYMVQLPQNASGIGWFKVFIQNHPSIYQHSYEKKFKQEIYDYIWTLMKQGKNRDQIYDALPIWLKSPESNWTAQTSPENSTGYLVVNTDGSPLSITDFLRGKGKIANLDFRWPLNNCGNIDENKPGVMWPMDIRNGDMVIRRVEFHCTDFSDINKYVGVTPKPECPMEHAYNKQLNGITKPVLNGMMIDLNTGVVTGHIQDHMASIVPEFELSEESVQIIMDALEERLTADLNNPPQNAANLKVKAFIKDQETEVEEVTVTNEEGEEITTQVYTTSPVVIKAVGEAAQQAQTVYQYEDLIAEQTEYNDEPAKPAEPVNH